MASSHPDARGLTLPAARGVAPGRIAAALVAGALALGVSARPAEAERRRVVVLPFSGPEAAAFRKEVGKLVKRSHAIVSLKKYERVADELELRRKNANSLARVAARIGADAYVEGEVYRRGGKYKLVVGLRSGRSGRLEAEVWVNAADPSLGRAARRQLERDLISVIGDLEPVDDAGAARARRPDRSDRSDRDDRDADKPSKRRKARVARDSRDDSKPSKRRKARVARDDRDADDGEDDADKPSKRRKARVARRDRDDRDDDGDSARDDDGSDEADDDEPARARRSDGGGGDDEDPLGGDVETRARRASALTDAERADRAVRGRGVEFSAGVAALSRTLTFVDDLPAEQSPLGYRSAFVPSAVLAAELYPLALSDSRRGIARNLGVTAVFDRVLQIATNIDNGGVPQALDTTLQRYGVGAVFRYNFGSSPTRPTIKLSVRLSRMQFLIDRQGDPMIEQIVDTPDVDYTYVDPGLAVRYPLSAKLAVNAEARGLLVLDTGQMQAQDQYGSATVTGLDADAGVEYRVNPRLSVRAGARAMLIGFAFDGGAELTNNRDGDAATVDVAGASDRYLGGYVTAGYLF